MGLSSPPPWSIAACQWLLIPTITGLTAGFTPPSSGVRSAAAVAAVALACSFQLGLGRSFGDIRISGPLGGVCWANVFNSMDVLLWSRINYQAQVEWVKSSENPVKDDKTPANSLFKRTRWSLALPFNYRRIGTPWQIRNLPIFDERTGRATSRSAFLVQAVSKLCLSVFLLAVSITEPDAPGVGKVVFEMTDRHLALVPNSMEISLRVVLAQTSFVLSFGLMSRCAINALYYSLVIISVGVCFSEPASWPPISGSVTQSWSIQRFWSSAWHQCYRVALFSNAKSITSVFGVRPDSTWAQYIRTALAFLISGFIHTMMDHGFGIPFGRSGSMWFFGLQAVGMMVERTAQNIYPTKTSQSNAVWKRAVGHLWVVVVLTWSARFWVNPLVWQLYHAGIPLPTPFLVPGSYRVLIQGAWEYRSRGVVM